MGCRGSAGTERRSAPSPTRPRCCPMDTAGTVLAVAGGCRAVEAARDASAHPVHAAFVTVAQGRLEAPMDRIGCLLLWACCGPNSVLPGPPGSTSRARNPREAWVASCRTVAGSLRCPCGFGEPCGRPVVAAFGQARPRGRRGIGFRASRRCTGRVSPVRALRGYCRAGGRRCPRYASCHMALAASSRAGAAYGCPGSGVGAPLLWCN